MRIGCVIMKFMKAAFEFSTTSELDFLAQKVKFCM